MPLWLTDVALLIALLVTSELAFRAGRSSRDQADENVRSQITTAQASMLGLLALILGFTLSMAESRFNGRRMFILEEAAAIGTTYLRAEYLPAPAGEASQRLLRTYVKERRAYYKASIEDAPHETARAEEIQAALWAEVVALAPRHLDADLVALYVDSLNKTIDLEGMRDVAVVSRLPWTIRFLLVLVALMAVGVSGYASGIGGRRVAISVWLLPVMIALACTVIADLDRSRAGFISTGDLPMIKLEQQLDADAAAQTSAQRP